jgi:hypothetical protein
LKDINRGTNSLRLEYERWNARRYHGLHCYQT